MSKHKDLRYLDYEPDGHKDPDYDLIMTMVLVDRLSDGLRSRIASKIISRAFDGFLSVFVIYKCQCKTWIPSLIKKKKREEKRKKKLDETFFGPSDQGNGRQKVTIRRDAGGMTNSPDSPHKRVQNMGTAKQPLEALCVLRAHYEKTALHQVDTTGMELSRSRRVFFKLDSYGSCAAKPDSI